MPESVALARQITCVRREIAFRRGVYPRWVRAGRMTAEKMQDEIAVMSAVLRTLKAVQSPDLFSPTEEDPPHDDPS